MRSDDEICRCARAGCLTQVSSRVRPGTRASRAGPRSPHSRKRSDSERARGRHRRDAQNPDTESYLIRRAEGPASWKDSGSNNRIYPAAFWSQSQGVNCYCNLESTTKSRFDRICGRVLVSNVTYCLNMGVSQSLQRNIRIIWNAFSYTASSLHSTDASGGVCGNDDSITSATLWCSPFPAGRCKKRSSPAGSREQDEPRWRLCSHRHLKSKKNIPGGSHARARQSVGCDHAARGDHYRPKPPR